MSAPQIAPCFLISQHAHLPLPRRKTDARSFELQVGRARLRIEAGSIFKNNKYIDQPLPYGRYARLCLIYINTTAIQKRTKEICLGDSVTGFVRTLIGRHPTGNDLESFRQQFNALEGATLKLGFQDDHGADVEVKMHLATEIKRSARQGGPGEKVTIILSDDYFSHLLAHAIPLPMPSIFALSGKPLALDIFCWLSARLCRVGCKDGQFIGWAALQPQFGSAYSQLRDFRRDFLKALAFAQAEYPGAKIGIENDPRPGGRLRPRGIRLYKSPPPISPKAEEESEK